MSDELPTIQVSDLTSTIPMPPTLPTIDAIPEAVRGSCHLYVVVLFAYHKQELRADCMVVPSLANDDQGSLRGAADHNRVIHPEAQWSGHQEYSTLIPDDLIRSVLPFMAQPNVSGLHLETPDPFAHLPQMAPPVPANLPVTLPEVNPLHVPTFPSAAPASPPPAAPDHLVVAMHSDRVRFNMPGSYSASSLS